MKRRWPGARGRRAALLATPLLFVLAGCRSEERAALPEEVVAAFIEKMGAVHGDPKAAREAYQLFWSEARRNLIERAKRASAVAGRTIAPEEMIAPSHFTLAFKPARFEARAAQGVAEVTVLGAVPETERATVRCALEDGEWRVVVDLPPLPPIQRRSGVSDE